MAAERFFEDAQHADIYAKCRPLPPVQLTGRIVAYLKEKYQGHLSFCVDLGCGNGQCSSPLAEYFDRVLATDISNAQIQVAKSLNHPANIEFQNCPAEQIPVAEGSVQLINASAAAHWFDLPAFFKEADRVLCSNGVIALSSYGIASHVFVHHPKSDELNRAFQNFYCNKLGPYWGQGNRHVYNEYADIVIPYDGVIREVIWTKESKTLTEIAAFLETGGPYQNYCRAKGKDAGQQLLNGWVTDCLNILETNEKADCVVLEWKRKYFLLMARKP